MDETGTVVFGRIDESFHQVAAAVVEEVLKRLGHTVDMREGEHPVMYPMLAAGELDLFADAWLPGGHTVYWEMVKDDAIKAADLYDDAKFFWAVPGYIPADQVSQIDDLTKPDVVSRMATLDVQGTRPSAGLSVRSNELVSAYGLDKVGYQQVPGDITKVIDNVNDRIAAGDWFVGVLWQPMFLNEVHDLRPLAEPKGIFPPPDRASLLANTAAWQRLPERTRAVLRRIHYSPRDVNLMDVWVAVDGADPNEAAARWLDENPETVAVWLAD